MLDEIVTETTRPDAPGADKSLFGDAEDETPPSVEEQDADKEAAQEPQGSDNAGDGADTETQTDASEELKVVVSIKRGRAVIGVQQPSSDPYIETFEDHDLPALAQEVSAVIERARARWEESPKHPAYERPAPVWPRGLTVNTVDSYLLFCEGVVNIPGKA